MTPQEELIAKLCLYYEKLIEEQCIDKEFLVGLIGFDICDPVALCEQVLEGKCIDKEFLVTTLGIDPSSAQAMCDLLKTIDCLPKYKGLDQYATEVIRPPTFDFLAAYPGCAVTDAQVIYCDQFGRLIYKPNHECFYTKDKGQSTLIQMDATATASGDTVNNSFSIPMTNPHPCYAMRFKLRVHYSIYVTSTFSLIPNNIQGFLTINGSDASCGTVGHPVANITNIETPNVGNQLGATFQRTYEEFCISVAAGQTVNVPVAYVMIKRSETSDANVAIAEGRVGYDLEGCTYD